MEFAFLRPILERQFVEEEKNKSKNGGALRSKLSPTARSVNSNVTDGSLSSVVVVSRIQRIDRVQISLRGRGHLNFEAVQQCN